MPRQSAHSAIHSRAIRTASLALASFVCLWALFVAFAEPLRVSAATDSKSAIVSVTINAAISLTCDDELMLDTITDFGTSDGTISCNIRTNNKDGYDLSWQVTTGSGGTNTGAMISEFEDLIPGFFASKEGLVGHWRLDELNAGDTVLDSSGNGNHGTPQGTGGANNMPQPSMNLPSTGNFLNVRSLDFDGTDDYVNIPNGLSALPNASSVTLVAWVKPNATAQSSFVSNWNAGAATVGLDMGMNSSRVIRCAFGNGSSTTFFMSGGAVVPLDTWSLVSCVRDNAGGNVYTYVNGSLGTTIALSGNTSVGAGIKIGTRGDGGDKFNGSVDDVRIYNRALSAAEIKSLYVQTQPWSIAASEGFWGARLQSASTDTDAKWGTDSSSEKWLNVGDGSYTVVSRLSETTHEGSDQVFDFRVQIGADKIQPTGTYQATVELIASAR